MKIVFSIALCWLFLVVTLPTAAQDSTHTNDGEWLIVFYAAHFSWEQVDNAGLYSMREDGSGKEMIVSEKELLNGRQGENVNETQLSPDGRKVAYTTNRDDGILFYDLETKQISELADGFSPSWSPDSQKIAFISFADSTSDGSLLYEIRVIDLLTQDEQLVLASRDMIMEPESNTRYFWHLAWSPDGKKLVLSVQLTPGSLQMGENLTQVHEPGNTLITVNLDGSHLRKILADDIQGYEPVWVDTNIIYFICYTQQDQPPAQICRINLETSSVEVVGDFRNILPEVEWIVDIAISPDEQIVFTHSYLAPDGKQGDLYAFDFSTNTLTNLDEEGIAMNGSVQWLYHT